MTGGHLDAESVHAHRELGARARRRLPMKLAAAGPPPAMVARSERKRLLFFLLSDANQPDTDHPARWVRFLTPRPCPWM